MLHTQHRSRAWHWHRPCPRANATSTLLSGHQVHSWTTHPMQGVKPQFPALLSVTSKVRMGLTSQCLHSLRCRVWGTRRVGAVIPHQGLASHCTWELPGFPSPHPGSSCSLDLHTQLAKPAPRGWVCSSKGWPHPLPPSLPPLPPGSVRHRELSLCLLWCCCSLPGCSQTHQQSTAAIPARAQPPDSLATTGTCRGAAGALCPWGFKHGSCDRREALVLLVPPQQSAGLWNGTGVRNAAPSTGTHGGKGDQTSGAANCLPRAPEST